eukprot:Pgem_evm1s19679
MILFFVRSSKYKKTKPTGAGSLNSLVYYVIRPSLTGQHRIKGSSILIAWSGLILSITIAIVQAFLMDENIAMLVSYISLTLALLCTITLTICHLNNDHLNSITEHKVLTIKEAKGVFDLIPIILTGNIIFGVLQNSSFGPMQAATCQSNLLVQGIQMNGAVYNIANSLAIVIFLPFLNRAIYPCLAKLKGSPISFVSKITSAFVICIIAMVIVLVLEIFRRSAPLLTREGYSNCAPVNANGVGIYMSDFSGYYYLIPFAVLGISECFFNPVMIDFVYTQSPPKTRSFCLGLVLVSRGAISSGFTAPIITSLSMFFPNDLNTGNLDKQFVTKHWADVDDSIADNIDDDCLSNSKVLNEFELKVALDKLNHVITIDDLSIEVVD